MVNFNYITIKNFEIFFRILIKLFKNFVQILYKIMLICPDSLQNWVYMSRFFTKLFLYVQFLDKIMITCPVFLQNLKDN